jgi:lysozyme
MTPSGNALRLIKQYEGLRLTAYQDAVGIWSVGYGNTFYPDGAKVQPGDKISIAKADSMLFFVLEMFGKRVDEMVTAHLSQNQFDALCSFAYNVGTEALRKSTLLKKVNKNPDDLTIEAEFLRWNKAKGKVLLGLTKRRQAEADLYFKD